MGRKYKIADCGLENEILRMYFLENLSCKDIEKELKKNNIQLTREGVRRFILIIKEYVKNFPVLSTIPKRILLDKGLKIDSKLLDEIFKNC